MESNFGSRGVSSGSAGLQQTNLILILALFSSRICVFMLICTEFYITIEYTHVFYTTCRNRR